MPDFYCSACRKTTAHKSIMRKNQQAPESTLGQIFSSIGQIMRGSHYYEMETLYFCRYCNTQHIEQNVELTSKGLSSPSRISAH